MDKQPALDKFSVHLKIITFGLIVFSSVVLALIFGTVLSYPIFGKDVLQNISLIGNSTNPDIIAIAKYFQIVSQFGFFLIPAFLFAYLDGRRIGEYLKINFKPALPVLIIAGITILAAVPLINFTGELNGRMKLPAFLSDVEMWMKESENTAKIITDAFMNSPTTGGFLVNILMIAIIPAIGEEFVFRGILQKLFHQWTKNIHVAIFISAFFFSSVHFQFYGFIPRFVMGVFLGYSFAWSGSLWVPVFIHFVNNAAAVVLSYFADMGKIDNTFDTVGTGDSATVPVLISSVLTAALIFLLYYFNKTKNKLSVPT